MSKKKQNKFFKSFKKISKTNNIKQEFKNKNKKIKGKNESFGKRKNIEKSE